ncbi:MAG TPA: hypothetical protein VHS09_02150, partial [Polyangiaceae bacterium]|nr:hypothetical protein [Polyangiaceae bacterium]
VGGDREQVAVLDDRAVGHERGHFGPLRAAGYFARGLLKRAQPALRAEPLVRVARLLGDAPARAFAPGPFEGAWGAGLGGLLRATTAAGASLHVTERAPGAGGPGTGGAGALVLQLVLAGAGGPDAPRASERLAAAFQVFAADPLGRLMGIDHPIEEPRISGDDEALRLEVTLDPLAAARGLKAATDARIGEILAY